MPPVAPQPVQLQCPACGTAFRAGIFTLIDVSEQPELKAAFLSGQVNVAVCPNCQTASMLAAPLIYHDSNKQLCLVYFPQELNARPEEQERFVGEATSFIMRSLPQNAPRTYLLSPRRFLTLPSLLDVILEADGISRDMLESQRSRVDLISELASVVEEPAAFQALVAQQRERLNAEFFATLNAFIAATPPNQADSRALLERVQTLLVEQLGPEALGTDAGDEEEFAADEAEIAAAIDRLSDSDAETLETAVAELRPLIDYSFFQIWTERIEAAEPAEADRLMERRTRVLEIIEEQDRQAQAMFEAGSAVLGAVLDSADPIAALHERADQIDEALIMVISANIGAAQRANRPDIAEQLEQIGQAAVEIIQGRLSPEERFINELLMAEKPADATRMLRKNVVMIKPDFVKQLNELADQEEKRANKPAAERLRQLAREAGAMLF